MYDTAYDRPLKSRAHCSPTVNSSGAARGGPMIQAVSPVACAMPAALARSASPVTRSARTAKRAGEKNWPAAWSRSTVA